MTRPVRIANMSGFYGDRLSAMAEMLDGGEIDVISGDYLAEVTMLILAKARERDPAKGYATTFLRQLEPVLADIGARRVKVVTNAGGLNPQALAAEIRALASAAGVAIGVAVVDGDDLLPRLGELQASGHRLEHLGRGTALADGGLVPLTANAYLGAQGIACALAEGADVVICGRVTDASLVVGPAIWWHGWEAGDLDRLAGAVAAGHVIECGAQATGGNYSSFTELDLTHPGFPIAEVDADGSSVITKHPGTGGAVTVGTVTAQLLYEIAGPRYLNPDVVARFDSTVVTQVGPDRVGLSGTRGEPPPPDTKVAITALGGWRNQTALMLTGLDIEAKRSVVERAMRSRFAGDQGIDRMEFQLIGAVADDPEDQGHATCELRCVVTGQDPRVVGRTFSGALVELGLASYPGLYFTTLPGDASSFGTYWPALVPQAVLRHRVTLPDGQVRQIAPPAPRPRPGPTGPRPRRRPPPGRTKPTPACPSALSSTPARGTRGATPTSACGSAARRPGSGCGRFSPSSGSGPSCPKPRTSTWTATSSPT